MVASAGALWAAEGRGRARTRSHGGLGPAIVACQRPPGSIRPGLHGPRSELQTHPSCEGDLCRPGGTGLTPARLPGRLFPSFALAAPLFPIPLFSLHFSLGLSLCSFSSFSPRLCGFPLSRSDFEVFFLFFFYFSPLVSSWTRTFRIQAPGPQRLPENRCAFLTSILLRERAEWPGGGTFL